MKKIAIVFIIIFFIVAGLLFTKNILANLLVSSAVKAISGLELNIKSLEVGVLKPAIHIKELKLFNPPEYPDRLMMDMPEVYLKYDLGSIIKGRIYLKHLILDLKEFVVVKNSQGQVNLNSLLALQPKGNANAKLPELKIDILDLKIGKVIYKDYFKGKLDTKEFKININERFKDITNPYAFSSIIVSKALMHTTISSLAGIDLGRLLEGTGNTLRGTVDVAKDVADKLLGVTADTLKEIIPFGNKQ